MTNVTYDDKSPAGFVPDANTANGFYIDLLDKLVIITGDVANRLVTEVNASGVFSQQPVASYNSTIKPLSPVDEFTIIGTL